MTTAALPTFTDATFDAEVLRSPLPVLVDFSAAWCGPCRSLTPILAEIARAYAGKLKVGQLDCDASPRASARFDVRSLPTLLLFKDGQVVGQLVGAVPRRRIEALMGQTLASASPGIGHAE